MSDGPKVGHLERLSRAARAARRRQRLNAALRRLARLLPVPLAYAALALSFIKWAQPGHALARGLGYGGLVALLVPVCGVALSLWRSRRDSPAGALALDRHHGSADRITNALSFAELAPEARSPFMEAAIGDALLAVARPSAARAVPVRMPRGAWISALLALAVVAISQLQPRPRPLAAPAPELVAIDPVSLTADDLGALRESIAELAKTEPGPELTGAVTRFNQLLEDIAERRLDRRQLFRRLADIDRSLDAGSEADSALEGGLRELAEELQKSRLSRPVAEALKEQRLPDADKALRELAERLKRKPQVDAAELERLRKALEAASSEASGRVQRLEEARRSLEAEHRRLLQKKGADATSPAEQSAEEQNHERRLERLERELSDAKRAEQQMSQLDRELAQAARELMKELGKSAEHLQAGAEDINRMARQQMSQKEKQELKQKLEELRELLRQGGPGREQQMRRLQQFAERARGSKGSGSPGERPGEQGQPGGPGGQRLTLGPGGRPIPIPGAGAPQPGAERPGSGGSERGGRETGSGSSPEIRGPATDLAGKTEDVTAAAVDTGKGAASSEVVFGAAQRGFTGSRYQKVYTQYRTVAEDVLEQDTIPAGYEFYVRRYFQLIRPRETP
jgi:hypothetical protein